VRRVKAWSWFTLGVYEKNEKSQANLKISKKYLLLFYNFIKY
jgi:hypothetical protein